MAKIIKFPVTPPEKKGPTKVRKRRKPDPEDHGQLNLFDQSKQIPLKAHVSLFEEALKYDESNDERAIALYEEVIEKGDSRADALCNLGIIMSRKENHAKAIDYFTSCLKEDPRHFEAHYNLANLYSDKENVELAIMHYQVAIEINPDFADTYYNLSLAFIARKSYSLALEYINHYVGLEPNEQQGVSELRKTLEVLIS